MEPEVNWTTHWKELAGTQHRFWSAKGGTAPDCWKKKARGFDQKVKQRWEQPDPHREFILSRLKADAGATLLDIGAGTGAWTVLLAPYAARVTALEPSEGMQAMLTENIARAGLDNVTVLAGRWPYPEIPPHEYTLCSHAMYGESDLAAFIRAMEAATRKTCFMLMRAPDPNGLLARAARLVWGQPNDSPNFQVALNLMFGMGIFPHVMMEPPGLWPAWTHDRFADAFDELLRRFGLASDHPAAPGLKEILAAHLVERDGKLVWPSEIRTALVYWDVQTP